MDFLGGRVGLGSAFLVVLVFIAVVTVVVLATFMYLYINGYRQTYNAREMSLLLVYKFVRGGA